MLRAFHIVRDLSKYSYTKGSDRIVVTQFDTGFTFVLTLLNKKEPMDLTQHRFFISFFDEQDKLLFTDECQSIQDLSLNPTTQIYYEVDERLTLNSGVVTAVIDLIDECGHRAATQPFKLTILSHLLKEPVSVPDFQPTPDEPEPSEPSDEPELPPLPELPDEVEEPETEEPDGVEEPDEVEEPELTE